MKPVAGPAETTTCEAERIPGPDGVVERGANPLSDGDAVARLKAGQDIVVCGAQRRANRNKARELTKAAFGDFEEDEPHDGRMALPHFHPPAHVAQRAHAFFEAPPRLAKKRKGKK